MVLKQNSRHYTTVWDRLWHETDELACFLVLMEIRDLSKTSNESDILPLPFSQKRNFPNPNGHGYGDDWVRLLCDTNFLNL